MQKAKLRIIRKRVSTRSKIGYDRPRLSLHRTNKYLFAQIVEPQTGKTILGMSDKNLTENKGTKSERAKMFGEQFAKEAQKSKIKEVVFDRGSFRYHGRISNFAQGARDGGLIF